MSKSLALVAILGGLAGTAYADLPEPPVADDAVPTADPPPTPAPIVDPAPTTTEVAPPTTTYVEPTIATVPTDEGVEAYAWREPGLQSGIGVGVTIGGGLTGFTDKTMRDTMSGDVGGAWDARLTLGTHVPIGLDLSYLGTAANVQSFAGTPNGTLVGTTTEAALRWNILPHEVVTPYIFGGVGWQHYDLRNAQLSVADSAMRTSDNMLEIPMGAGLAVRGMNGFTLDARGTFRAQATDSDLVLDTQTGQYAKLHTWEASANLGYEF